ncbi:MAG: hypothetical protein R3332_10520 [Pseudohongiellaceae bacterium]|nr:hypothetical protein [Pseudohongiellaceae bacterium]
MLSLPPNKKPNPNYPKLAERLLMLCLSREIRDYVLGDLTEEFADRAQFNPSLASRWAWKQTLTAILKLSFRGNLKALAIVLNFMFFAVLSFVLLSLSGFNVHISWPFIFAGLVALPFILLPISNNRGVISDMLYYISTPTRALGKNSLMQLSQFAAYACNYCVLVSPIFMLTPLMHIFITDEIAGQTPSLHFLMGMALMTLVHATALHSMFYLLKIRGEQDAQLAIV